MRHRPVLSAAVATAIAAGIVVGVPTGIASAAVTVPTGFLLQDTPTDLGGQPLTDFAFLPDASMIAIGKNGRVNWVPETGPARHIESLPTVANTDMGLLGVAVRRTTRPAGRSTRRGPRRRPRPARERSACCG